MQVNFTFYTYLGNNIKILKNFDKIIDVFQDKILSRYG